MNFSLLFMFFVVVIFVFVNCLISIYSSVLITVDFPLKLLVLLILSFELCTDFKITGG